MGKGLQPPEGLPHPIFRLHHNHRLQIWHQTALARNAELGREAGMDMGDRTDFHGYFFAAA